MLNIDAGGVQSRRIIDRWSRRNSPQQLAGLSHGAAQPEGRAQAQEAGDIAQLRAGARPDGAPLPGFSAGSHIDVHVPAA
jgi:hypothetical protein